MFDLILKVLGIGGGGVAAGAVGQVVNGVSGAVNHMVFLPVIAYLVTHADEEIHLQTSLGFLSLVVAVAYLVLEVQRRSAPKSTV